MQTPQIHRKRLRSFSQLEQAGLVSNDAAANPALQAVARCYAIGVTSHVATQIRDNPDSAIAKQYMPDARELVIAPGERIDPIGDDAHTPVKGIVHRYPDRVLFKVTSACAVYCRFCFRKEKVGKASESLSKAEMDTALTYIRTHAEIFEVILSGGDPLVLPLAKLKQILDDICANPHVQVVRFHTRLPVVDPDLFTPDYCATLGAFEKPVYLVLHTNHADELAAPNVQKALQNLRRAGVILLSQSVILKGINDNAAALETLLRTLVAHGVKPYYLHHPDMATGTSHLRITIAEGQNLMRALRGKLTGIAWPTYVLDVPGGHGKMPIDLGYMQKIENGFYKFEDYQGGYHIYPPQDTP